MRKVLIIIAIALVMPLLQSCMVLILPAVYTVVKSKKHKKTNLAPVEMASLDVIHKSLVDSTGMFLNLSFHLLDEELIIQYKDKSAVLQQKQADSILLYANKEYEYMEVKGEHFLTRKGKNIFYHRSTLPTTIVNESYSDKYGQLLDVSFYLNEGLAKVHLGRDKTVLRWQNSSRGIHYANDSCDLVQGQGGTLFIINGLEAFDLKP